MPQRAGLCDADKEDGVVTDLARLADGSCVDLEDFHARNFIRQWDLDLAVDPSWPHQRGVECIGSVRSHDDLRLSQIVKAVHLVEKLQVHPRQHSRS
jgi:hypothetical protein